MASCGFIYDTCEKHLDQEPVLAKNNIAVWKIVTKENNIKILSSHDPQNAKIFLYKYGPTFPINSHHMS
jgi:hypothetical protein